MDNKRRELRIKTVHNLLTGANEQITKHGQVKECHSTLSLKCSENSSKIVCYNLQLYSLLDMYLRNSTLNFGFGDLHFFFRMLRITAMTTAAATTDRAIFHPARLESPKKQNN